MNKTNNNNMIIIDTRYNLLVNYKQSLVNLVINKNKDSKLIKRQVEPANITRIIKCDNNTDGVSTVKKITVQQSKKVITLPLAQKLNACLKAESLKTFRELLKVAFHSASKSEEAKQITNDLSIFISLWSFFEY